MGTLVRLTLALAAIYVLLGVVVFALQRRLIYHPPAPVDPAFAGAKLIRFRTDAGLPVVAVHVPASPGQMTVVHFHGNADQLADVDVIARLLHAQGLGFYAVEYPGYGFAADAAPTEENVYAVADAAIDHLTHSLGVPANDILLQGHSLGSGVAAEMAARSKGARLVLVSPYTSIADMAARMVPIFPSRWLVRDRYDTIGKAARLRLPVLILHGRNDAVIPVSMGQRLGAAIAGASVIIEESSGHDDVFAIAGYAACIAAFSRGERCTLP